MMHAPIDWSFWSVLALGVVVVGVIAGLIIECVIAPRANAREAAAIAKRITPLSKEKHYRFIGHDDELRKAAGLRRQWAEAKKREAAKIASGEDTYGRIRIVGRG